MTLIPKINSLQPISPPKNSNSANFHKTKFATRQAKTVYQTSTTCFMQNTVPNYHKTSSLSIECNFCRSRYRDSIKNLSKSHQKRDTYLRYGNLSAIPFPSAEGIPISWLDLRDLIHFCVSFFVQSVLIMLCMFVCFVCCNYCIFFIKI